MKLKTVVMTRTFDVLLARAVSREYRGGKTYVVPEDHAERIALAGAGYLLDEADGGEVHENGIGQKHAGNGNGRRRRKTQT